MSVLFKNEQHRLLAAIWNDETLVLQQNGFDAQGINIYQRNLLANAQRALSISFPTIFKLLDSDISASLVHQFLRSSPPSQGDWGQWGETFTTFLSSHEVSENYPYLPDCAALDWHIHCGLHGKDQTFERPSLQLLSDSEPEYITVIFNQNVKVISSQYPITEILQAHHHSDEIQRKGAMKKAQEALLSIPKEHWTMIYRPEFQPQVTRLSVSEGNFMHCLMSGSTLAQALDMVSSDHDFVFEKWLIAAIERNLIYYFSKDKP